MEKGKGHGGRSSCCRLSGLGRTSRTSRPDAVSSLQGQQQDQPAPPPQDDQQPGQSPVQSPGKRPVGLVGPMQSLLLQANSSTGKALHRRLTRQPAVSPRFLLVTPALGFSPNNKQTNNTKHGQKKFNTLIMNFKQKLKK